MYSWDRSSAADVLFLSPSHASRASPTWLKTERKDFYACFLRRYLHGPQSCFPYSEKRCTLFRRSSGPYENLLLLQNGENITISISVKCCAQIKPMTEGYDDSSPQTISLKTMYLKNYKRYSFAVFNIRFK